MKIQIETTALFASKEAFLAFRAAWKAQAHLRQPLSAESHLLYLLLSGKEVCRGFSPITNTNRLQYQAGGNPFATLKELMLTLRARCVKVRDTGSKDALRMPDVFRAIEFDPQKFADAVLNTSMEGL
jgi:hypothetical protein